MLLIKKYTQNNFNKIFFNKELIDFINFISKDKSLPNIIICGYKGSGKKTLINTFLTNIYNKEELKENNVKYKFIGCGNKEIIENIKQGNNHINIISKNNNSDIYTVQGVIKEYVNTKSFNSSGTFKTIIINDIGKMLYNAQSSLRRAMELYTDNCRFILTCYSLSEVIKPLRSRCLLIKLTPPNIEELRNFVSLIIKNENINISNEEVEGLISNNINIKKIIWYLQCKKLSIPVENVTKKNYEKIFKIFQGKNFNNLKKIEIKNLLTEIIILNINIKDILSKIIKFIIKLENINEYKKLKILSKMGEFEYFMRKGRREIIQYDFLINYIFNILKN